MGQGMRDFWNWWICFWIVVMGLMCFLLASTRLGHAHDYEHPELMPWFQSLQNKHGVSCCDGADAQHLSDVEWRMKDGHYEVYLDDEWQKVPDEAVVDEPNKEGVALIWTANMWDGQKLGHYIRCFMPGAGT